MSEFGCIKKCNLMQNNLETSGHDQLPSPETHTFFQVCYLHVKVLLKMKPPSQVLGRTNFGQALNHGPFQCLLWVHNRKCYVGKKHNPPFALKIDLGMKS